MFVCETNYAQMRFMTRRPQPHVCGYAWRIGKVFGHANFYCIRT